MFTLRGGCTPKRSRNFDIFEMGGYESPNKRRKFTLNKETISNSENVLNVEDLDRDQSCKEHKSGLSGDQLTG